MKAVQSLYKLPLSWMEVQKLPQDQQAALAITNFAASEVNTLQRLFVFSAHRVTDDNDINAAIMIQRFSVLRRWSASLFEFREFLSFGPKPKEKANDMLVQVWAKASVEKYRALEAIDGYGVVRDIRNEAGSHYSFSAAKKNIKHVSDIADCNLYPQAQGGNSYFPMGEEVMFLGRLNRHGANLKTKEEKMKLFDNWMAWNIQAAKWLSHVQSDLVGRILKAHFPEKKPTKRIVSIDPVLVGNEADIKVPIFYRSAQ